MLKHDGEQCPILRQTYPNGMPADSSACCAFTLGIGKGAHDLAIHIAQRLAGVEQCDAKCIGCEAVRAITQPLIAHHEGRDAAEN